MRLLLALGFAAGLTTAALAGGPDHGTVAGPDSQTAPAAATGNVDTTVDYGLSVEPGSEPSALEKAVGNHGRAGYGGCNHARQETEALLIN